MLSRGREGREQVEFEEVPSVKFELYLPVSYRDEAGEIRFVQGREIIAIAEAHLAKYGQFGGYSMSNPFAPPPTAGAEIGQPQERSYWLMFILPDQLLAEARKDIEVLVRNLQTRYHQREIFTHWYTVTRLRPIPKEVP